VRSRSLTREDEVLSGEEGWLLDVALGARLGVSTCFDFLEDLVKSDGRTGIRATRLNSGPFVCDGN
jgi:hypothetical protein